jgi:hypothetical protein
MKSYIRTLRKLVKKHLNVANIFTYNDRKYVNAGHGMALWDNNLLPRTLQLDIQPSDDDYVSLLNQIVNEKPLYDCNVCPVVIKQCEHSNRVMIIREMVYYCDDEYVSIFEEYGDVYYKATFDDCNFKYPRIYVYACRDDLLIGIFLQVISEHNVLLSFVDELHEICTTLTEIA